MNDMRQEGREMMRRASAAMNVERHCREFRKRLAQAGNKAERAIIHDQALSMISMIPEGRDAFLAIAMECREGGRKKRDKRSWTWASQETRRRSRSDNLEALAIR